MTKKEAMAFAISTGKPIRHQTFSNGEYVIYVGKELHDEEGIILPQIEFLEHTQWWYLGRWMARIQDS